jgi:hypothetical protein
VTANGVTGGDPNKVGTTGGTVTGTLDLAAASNPLQIPHGAATGEVWTATDNAGDGAWQAAPGGTPATTVQPGTTYGTSTAVGTLGSFAREDHQHGTPSLTSSAPAATLGIGTAAAAGTATLPARADHVHPTAAAGAPAASAVGDTSVTGVATTFAASDHKHGREAFGTPGASAVGDAAAAGSAATVAHSDHVHGREAYGAVTALASFGTASSNGTATTNARSDHVHGAPSLPVGSTSTTGIVQIDNAAADYQPIGPAAPGAVGKVADAGHTHPYAPWQFSPYAYGAKGDGKIALDGAISSGTNTLACTTSTPFAAGDVNKPIAIKGAGPAGVTTLVTTISGFTDSGHVTLTTNASATITGAQVMWATDDTSAFQQAINNATAYATGHGQYGEVVVPSPSGYFYGIAGNLTTAVSGNSQLTLPIVSDRNPKVTLAIRGAGNSGSTRHWNQNYPPLNPSTLVSFGVFGSAALQSNTGTNCVNNAGNPSVLGGPTGKGGYGTSALLYNNMLVSLENLTILTTHSSSGWTYSACNFHGMAAADLRNFSYGTTAVIELYNGNSGDFTNVTTLSGGISIGILLPSAGNNADNKLENVTCHGGYTYALLATEHTVGRAVTLLYCWSGLCPVGNYGDSGASTSALHASQFDQLCIEACTYHVNVFGAGQSNIGPIVHATLDTEGTLQFRDNPNNGTGLNAASGEIRLAGSPSTVNLTFPTGLRIIKEQTLPGVASSPPALSANTAVMNTLWRPATVYLVGGANLTTIQVSQLAGGAAAPAVSTVADFTSAGTISVPFPVRLGPGQWIKLNTASGTTVPAATWVLD